ncbi:hypothetical protein [Clostridium estertheticum]|uniref:hypothetical protein n=1 Tax=Clostridium estertheticum TaxID=238834 RepID=UPI001C0E4091|nr:hypothetical protein [Clostridium estertheticum]MBU3184963.1 hypothetical protein [Clostridium estertheticum]
MYYAKIDEFVKGLNKGNIEELKPQLRKYVGQLMLLIKDQDNNLSLDDIDSMLDILIMREEFQEDMEKELKAQNSKFGLLTDEFMNVYKEFMKEIVENSYTHYAISLTKSVLKALGCTHRDVFLTNKYKGLAKEMSEYIRSIDYLEDLQQLLYEHLNQYVKEVSREYLLILGLVNYIKCELKESIDGIGETILSILTNKSLEEFNKEEHINELKSMLNKDYIKELQRRVYSWNTLSSKLTEGYYIDELYKNLE